MSNSRVQTGAGDPPSGLVSARVRERMVERVRELGVKDSRVLEAREACRAICSSIKHGQSRV